MLRFLPRISPLAGFSWDVDDPGGSKSILRYEVAADASSEAERETARTWILTYNRGDVEATLAIRRWLENDARFLPSIQAVEISR